MIFKSKKLLFIPAIIILFLLSQKIHNPNVGNITLRFATPSVTFILGNDQIGRDIFSRIIFGTGVSVSIAILSSITIIFLSTLMASITLTKNNLINKLINWITIVGSSFPTFLLSITLSGLLGPGLFNVYFSIVIFGWTKYLIIMRSYIKKINTKDYITFLKISNFPSYYIMFFHIIPKIINPIISLILINISRSIIMVSSLSFLGIGAPSNVPELGQLISDAQQYFQTSPSLIIYPSIVLILISLSFNLIGKKMLNDD